MPVTHHPGARPPLQPSRLSVRGYDVQIVEQSASTNQLVADRALAGAPEGLVVVAEHQTAGRGRLDRVWATPARAALTFSVLLRPIVPAARWPWLPLLAGAAVTEALRQAHVTAGLKWPNDVLIGDRKVAGLLVERIDTEAGAAAVVGIGINVSTTAEELPVPSATSLHLAGAEVDRTDLLGRILRTLRDEYDAWQAAPDDRALRAAYREQCVTVANQRVRIDLPDGTQLVGVATDVAEDGGLLVAGPDGVLRVHAGDVIHVRADEQ